MLNLLNGRWRGWRWLVHSLSTTLASRSSCSLSRHTWRSSSVWWRSTESGSQDRVVGVSSGVDFEMENWRLGRKREIEIKDSVSRAACEITCIYLVKRHCFDDMNVKLKIKCKRRPSLDLSPSEASITRIEKFALR
ncbi:hypothetical protein QQ045_010898 [Rhodiola kirilowii]